MRQPNMGGNCSEDAARRRQCSRKSVAIVHDLQPIYAAIRAQQAVTQGERVETTMTTIKNPEQGTVRAPNHQQEPTSLDARYGEIGISAVAAALPYTGDKSPAQPEAAVRIDQRFIEVAA
jgi:hypothetical protein